MTNPRGFANLTKERRREIAAKGGRSVPNDRRSFSQNRELAAEAARKGGAAGAHKQKGSWCRRNVSPKQIAEQ